MAQGISILNARPKASGIDQIMVFRKFNIK